jgi:hypothetical protein
MQITGTSLWRNKSARSNPRPTYVLYVGGQVSTLIISLDICYGKDTENKHESITKDGQGEVVNDRFGGNLPVPARNGGPR